jgi:hypothetical protein
MQVQFDRVCGLDVHRDSIMACARVPKPGSERRGEVQSFGTTTSDLLTLRDWLKAHGVTHVAMESTGVLWKPVYYMLEGEFTVISIPEGKRVLKAGGVDWAAKGTIHSSRNDSTRPARILVILFKER